MVQVVPIQPNPNQTVQVVLSNQACTLNIYQKSTGLFMDVLVDDVLIIGGVICQNLNRIVRSLYLGFIGDFAWVDVQGTVDANGIAVGTDPVYTGFGTQYFLIYATPDELNPVFTG